MDRLQAMHTFVTIAEQGSLTAAARALGKSLPTVVRTLAALEAHLQARLLSRTTRRMALTDEGRRYLERCHQILAQVADAEAEVVDDGEAAGQLTVTAPVLFGQLHVVPGVAAFLERHPRVAVDLLLLDQVVDLVEEGVDIAVRIARLEDSSLVARRVGQVRRVICASPRYLERAGRPAHPRDLPGFECLRWRTRHGGNTWRFQEQGRPFNVHPRGRFASNHVAGALNACVAGVGIASFLSYQVAPHLASGALQVLLPEFELDPIPVSLVHTHARLVPPRVRTLMDWLAEDVGARLAETAAV